MICQVAPQRARELSIVLTVATARAHRRVFYAWPTGHVYFRDRVLPVTVAGRGRTSRVCPGLLSESLKIPSQGISASAVKLPTSHRCFIEREMPDA